jgi:hypothetical protein
VTRKVNNIPHGVCTAETTFDKTKGGKAMMMNILSTQSKAYFTMKGAIVKHDITNVGRINDAKNFTIAFKIHVDKINGGE